MGRFFWDTVYIPVITWRSYCDEFFVRNNIKSTAWCGYVRRSWRKRSHLASLLAWLNSCASLFVKHFNSNLVVLHHGQINNNNNNVRLFWLRHNAQSTVTSATQRGTGLYAEGLRFLPHTARSDWWPHRLNLVNTHQMALPAHVR